MGSKECEEVHTVMQSISESWKKRNDVYCLFTIMILQIPPICPSKTLKGRHFYALFIYEAKRS